MTALTIGVLIDPRWPDQIPLEAIPYLQAVAANHLEVAANIPTTTRDQYHQLAATLHHPTNPNPTTCPTPASPVARLIITSDETDPRLTSPTTHLIQAPSRDDPTWQAQHIMRRALTVGEWEQQQTHNTLLPYLHEETTELADAIATHADDTELMAELGDVLLQILFHAEIAARRGAFDFSDVVGSFIKKMRRRSPYLFDGTTSVVSQAEQKRLWQLGKREENQHADAGSVWGGVGDNPEAGW